MNNYPVLRSSAIAKSQRIVPYLTPSEVKLLAGETLKGRHGQRDALLIEVLFQCALRISEALSLSPSSIQRLEGRLPVLVVLGKGKKLRRVSIPEPLADKLRSYAYEKGLQPGDRFFPINRFRAWQIINTVSKKVGLQKRIHPHLFRHSGSVERLRQHKNPRALMKHLGHSSMATTMRYLSTLEEEDAVFTNSEVRFE